MSFVFFLSILSVLLTQDIVVKDQSIDSVSFPTAIKEEIQIARAHSMIEHRFSYHDCRANEKRKVQSFATPQHSSFRWTDVGLFFDIEFFIGVFNLH